MTAFAERHYRSLIFAIWLITALLFLFIARGAIADWKMGDPDDQLRLVQVRDWLAGQSWWDITQYRMNPPEGGPMHWSRLVDIPIAGMILLLTPFLGPALAEQWASAIVPLFTYGSVLVLFSASVKRLFGASSALLAAATFFAILPATVQLLPMRIDHHGWQLFCFFLASWALFDRKRSLFAAVIMGLAMALWVEISIEGLPFAILFMSLLALRWLSPSPKMEGQNIGEHQLSVALLSLAIASTFFFVATEGLAASANYCDGLSPFHLGSFAAAALVLCSATGLAKLCAYQLTLLHKLCIGIFAAAAGLVVVLITAPECSRDAFASLDPLVREYWYNRTAEGLPLWAVSIDNFLPPIIALGFGAIGLFWLWQKTDQLVKADRLALTLLFVGSVLISSMVSRTIVYALCLGSMMLAPLVIALFHRADRSSGLAPRMGFRIAAVILLLPLIIGQNITNSVSAVQTGTDRIDLKQEEAFLKLARACQKSSSAMKLAELPQAQLMVGLDTSPAILQFTRHKVIATGHHRNQQAMADVIRTFTGSADQAKLIMQQRKVEYLVTCEGSFELRAYRQNAPQGFWAQMHEGAVPAWLVRQPDIGPFQIWRTDWTMP